MAGVDQSPELPGIRSARHRIVRAIPVPGWRDWWPYLIVSLVTILLRWPTLSNRILGLDEPSYLAQADRLQSPYAFIYAFFYRTETKTQIGLLPYILANALDRANSIWLLHLFGLLAALLGCYLLLSFARRFLGNPFPGLIAALIWLSYLAVGPGYPWPPAALGEAYLQVRLEYFQTPLILASLYALTWAIAVPGPGSRSRSWLLATAGVSWAIAALIKPSVALLPLLFAGILIIWPHQSPPAESRSRAAIGRIALVAAGASLPLALVFVPYLFSPAALAELRFNLVTVNGSYADGQSLPVRAAALTLGIPPVLLGPCVLAAPWFLLALCRRHADPATRAVVLVLLAGLAVFVGSLPGRAYWYYLIPIIPLLALPAAHYCLLGVCALRARRRPQLAQVLALSLALLYLGSQVPGWLAWQQAVSRDYYLDDARRRFDLDGLVRYVQAHTRPQDSIWVYYGTPELYQLVDRRPATRDPAGVWLASLWQQPWFTRTAGELEAEKPVLIIGIQQPRFVESQALPLPQIPHVNDLLARAYRCDSAAVRGATICAYTGTP